MTYGITYNWSDYVHVNYGFPLTFATHTLDTIAGPVDRWTLSLDSLTLDLAFWSVSMVAMSVIALCLARTEARGEDPSSRN
jgi:hypothetical protein